MGRWPISGGFAKMEMEPFGSRQCTTRIPGVTETRKVQSGDMVYT
jgi:hypothetical protein